MTPDEAVVKLEQAPITDIYPLSLAASGYSAQEIATILEADYDEYYHFIYWGPAAMQVQNFLSAYSDASLAYMVSPDKAGVFNLQDAVEELWGDMRAAKVGRKLNAWVVLPDYCSKMSEKFMNESSKVLNGCTTTNGFGVWAICWMITGQVLFPPDLVEEFQPYVERVDGILSFLNQPPLGGFFTP